MAELKTAKQQAHERDQDQKDQEGRDGDEHRMASDSVP